MKIDISYNDLINNISDSVIRVMREEIFPNDDPDYSFEGSIKDNYFFEEADEIIFGESHRLARQHGLYENEYDLSHDGAMFVIKNSDNIHQSIDGMYRKDDYLGVAAGCIYGDVCLCLSKKLNIPLDGDPFDRVR